MDAKLKALWVEALRSGEYEQARGTLKDPDGGYCCLGVLAHVAAKAGMLGSATEVHETVDKMTVTFNDDDAIWEDDNELYGGCFGLDEFVVSQCMTLNDGDMTLNDGDPSPSRRTFAEIADFIEANIPAEA